MVSSPSNPIPCRPYPAVTSVQISFCTRQICRDFLPLAVWPVRLFGSLDKGRSHSAAAGRASTPHNRVLRRLILRYLKPGTAMAPVIDARHTNFAALTGARTSLLAPPRQVGLSLTIWAIPALLSCLFPETASTPPVLLAQYWGNQDG